MAVYNYRMFKTSTPRNTSQMSDKVANSLYVDKIQ